MLQRVKKGRTTEHIVQSVLLLCGVLSIFTTLGIVAVLLFETVAWTEPLE